MELKTELKNKCDYLRAHFGERKEYHDGVEYKLESVSILITGEDFIDELFKMYQNALKEIGYDKEFALIDKGIIDRTTCHMFEIHKIWNPPPTRVFIFCHGYAGSEKDWDTVKSKIDPNIKILFATSNRYIRSWLGIETCGTNLANEMNEYFKLLESEQITEIDLTIVGHSFGGIYSRRAIYLLFGSNSKYHWNLKINLRGFWTMATPHLGVCKPTGKSMAQTVMRYAMDYCGFFGGWTGYELALCNDELQQLADQDHINVLAKFESLVLIGAIAYDETVPFASSLIHQYRLPKSLLATKSDEPRIVWDDIAHISSCGITGRLDSKRAYDEDQTLEFSKETFDQLNKLQWRRIIVDFGVTENSFILPVHLYFVGKQRLFSFSYFDTVSRGNKRSDWFTSKLVEMLKINKIQI